MTCETFIASRKVADLLKELKPQSDLVDVPSNATLEYVFEVLLANDILSVPVYKDQSQPKEYLGFVSVQDLVHHIFEAHHTLSSLQSEPEFLLEPVSQALGKISKVKQILSVKSADPLSLLVRVLSHDLVHRVLVWTEDQAEPYVVSQRDLIRYFHAHNHELGKILDLSAPEMAEASGLSTHVPTITFRHTAWEAFRQVAHNMPLSAIPVLDDSGSLVTNISAEDLRGLNRARLRDLERPIVCFLKGSHGEDGIMPLTCHSRFTLQQIMAALVLGQAHRIWLCTADDQVEGVVTLTDVIAVIDVLSATPTCR